MGMLAGTNYDPGSAVSASTASLLAMTAFDTTNLRLTFTAPANGIVRVRMRCSSVGAASSPQLLLGVLDGITVRGRQAPFQGRQTGGSTIHASSTANFIVTGLTPGTSYTWDAAYGVEFAVASTNIKYGGPNDNTTSNAWGGFTYEVWDTPSLLAGTMYDPGSAATKATTSVIAVTAFDTSNLRLTFTGPASGNVLVRQRFMNNGGVTYPSIFSAVLEGATVRARVAPTGSFTDVGTLASTDHIVYDSFAPVTGLTPGTSYTWDAAYGVENAPASSNIRYGGPDNTSQDDAYGGYLFEILDASSFPVGVSGGFV